MAELFRGLNQIIPSKPSLARPAFGFFSFFFCLDFTMKLESGMPAGGMAGSRGGEEGKRPFLGFRVLGALSPLVV